MEWIFPVTHLCISQVHIFLWHRYTFVIKYINQVGTDNISSLAEFHVLLKSMVFKTMLENGGIPAKLNPVFRRSSLWPIIMLNGALFTATNHRLFKLYIADHVFHSDLHGYIIETKVTQVIIKLNMSIIKWSNHPNKKFIPWQYSTYLL